MIQHFDVRELYSGNVIKHIESALKQASKDLDFSTTSTLPPLVEKGSTSYLLNEPWIIGAYSNNVAATTGTNGAVGLVPSDFKKKNWKKYLKTSLKRDNFFEITSSNGFKLNTGDGNDYLELSGKSDIYTRSSIKMGKGSDTIHLRDFVRADISLGNGNDVITGIPRNGGHVVIKDYNHKEDVVKGSSVFEWFNDTSDNSIILKTVPKFYKLSTASGFDSSLVASGSIKFEGVYDINSLVFDGTPHLINVDAN